MIKKMCAVFLFSSCVQAGPITWIAQNPSNDMNDAANWSPSSVPGSSDVAVFDSAMSGIATNSTESSAPFSISALNFPNLASPFLFTFSNQPLAFSGAGITGSHTNATLSLVNTNNMVSLGDMVSFAALGTTGSATITATNSASLTGAQSGHAIGIINSHLHASGAYTIADGGSMTAHNSGTNSATGVGNNQVGVANAAQVLLQATGVVGNDVSITVTNTGTNSSAPTSFNDEVAYLNDNQLFVGEALQAGDRFTLAVSNTGNDSSTGIGQAQVAAINSTSGPTGDQILFRHGGRLGNNATINVTNVGTYTGTNSASGCFVGGMNQGQLTVGDFTSVGSYNFSARDNFRLTVSNSGIDSAVGTGNDVVGTVSTTQVTFFTPCSVGNQAQISIDNSGTYAGTASAAYVNIGSAGGSQFNALSTFEAGDGLTLQVTNAGENESNGIGGFFIGDLITGQQVHFGDDCTIGNNATITITNRGSNAADTTNQNQVGSMMGYGAQFRTEEGFHVRNNFSLTIANTGSDSSTGSGNNLVGFINNNTVDSSASQLHLASGGTVGNNASITLSNTGTLGGSNSGSNLIATLSGGQCASVAAFEAGNEFNLTLSQVGTSNASGQNNNSVSQANGSQVDFRNDCTLGNGASFVISNSGVNNDAAGINNVIGAVAHSQMRVAGDFSAGTDLTLRITNSAENAGDNTNAVGSVAQAQLSFEQGCTFGDGSVIAVTNSGSVGGSQLFFGQGFNVASGTAEIMVTNGGTVGIYGIEIDGNSAGGNAAITLGNSSLYVATSLPTFTIGGLSGDETSTAQSQPTLIINQTRLNQSPIFAGVIQDFPEMLPTVLTKTGAGTQILSGLNTYTGLTAINEGTLVVNGSLAGNMVIDADGTLKGSGTINGTVTNNGGTIAPGQSIGTITMGTYINNGSTYDVEVNGAGQSDLINVLGSATITGDSAVAVTPDDFNFLKPRIYTIITTGTGVTGTFSSRTSSVPALLKLLYNSLTVQLAYFPIDALGSCNARNAGRCFVTLTGADADLITNTLFTLNTAGIQEAFEQMSPAQFSGPTEVQLLDAILVRSTYTKHMQKFFVDDPCVDEKAISFWFDGIAQWQHQGNPFGYNDTTLGFTCGIDYSVWDSWILGAAFSTTYDQFSGKQTVSNAALNSYYAGLYSRWNQNKWYINAALLGALNKYKTERQLNFGTIDRCAYGTHEGTEYLVHAGLAYEIDRSSCQILPYLNLDYVIQHENSFTETGAGILDLTVRKKNAMLFQGEAGVSLRKAYQTQCGTLIPMLTLAYINQTPCSSKNYCANFVDSACVFTGKGGNYERNLFAPRLALAYHDACDTVNISVHYDGQVGSKKYWAQDVAFDLTVRF